MSAALANSSAITNCITSSVTETDRKRPPVIACPTRHLFALGERGREKLTEEAVPPSSHPTEYSTATVAALTSLCRFCCLPYSCKQCPGSA